MQDDITSALIWAPLSQCHRWQRWELSWHSYVVACRPPPWSQTKHSGSCFWRPSALFSGSSPSSCSVRSCNIQPHFVGFNWLCFLLMLNYSFWKKNCIYVSLPLCLFPWMTSSLTGRSELCNPDGVPHVHLSVATPDPLLRVARQWLAHSGQRLCEAVVSLIVFNEIDQWCRIRCILNGAHYYAVTTRGQKNRVREELAGVGPPSRLFPNQGMRIMAYL